MKTVNGFDAASVDGAFVEGGERGRRLVVQVARRVLLEVEETKQFSNEWEEARWLASRYSVSAANRWPADTEAYAAAEILLYCAACCAKSSKNRCDHIEEILKLKPQMQGQLMASMKAQMAADKESVAKAASSPAKRPPSPHRPFGDRRRQSAASSSEASSSRASIESTVRSPARGREEITSLRRKLAEASAEAAAYREEASELRARLAEHEEARKQERERALALELSAMESEQKQRVACEEKATSSREEARLAREAARAAEARAQAADEQLAAAKDEMDVLRACRDELEGVRRQLERTKAKAAEASELRAELRAAQDAVAEATEAKLLAEARSRDRDALEQRLDDTLDRAAGLEADLREARAAEATLLAAKQEAESKLTSVSATLEHGARDVEDDDGYSCLDNESETKKAAEVARLRHEVSELRQALEEANPEVARQLRRQLDEALRMERAYENSLAKAKAELGKQREKLAAACTDKAAAEDETARFAAALKAAAVESSRRAEAEAMEREEMAQRRRERLEAMRIERGRASAARWLLARAARAAVSIARSDTVRALGDARRLEAEMSAVCAESKQAAAATAERALEERDATIAKLVELEAQSKTRDAALRAELAASREAHEAARVAAVERALTEARKELDETCASLRDRLGQEKRAAVRAAQLEHEELREQAVSRAVHEARADCAARLEDAQRHLQMDLRASEQRAARLEATLADVTETERASAEKLRSLEASREREIHESRREKAKAIEDAVQATKLRCDKMRLDEVAASLAARDAAHARVIHGLEAEISKLFDARNEGTRIIEKLEFELEEMAAELEAQRRAAEQSSRRIVDITAKLEAEKAGTTTLAAELSSERRARDRAIEEEREVARSKQRAQRADLLKEASEAMEKVRAEHATQLEYAVDSAQAAQQAALDEQRRRFELQKAREQDEVLASVLAEYELERSKAVDAVRAELASSTARTAAAHKAAMETLQSQANAQLESVRASHAVDLETLEYDTKRRVEAARRDADAAKRIELEELRVELEARCAAEIQDLEASHRATRDANRADLEGRLRETARTLRSQVAALEQQLVDERLAERAAAADSRAAQAAAHRARRALDLADQAERLGTEHQAAHDLALAEAKRQADIDLEAAVACAKAKVSALAEATLAEAIAESDAERADALDALARDIHETHREQLVTVAERNAEKLAVAESALADAREEREAALADAVANQQYLESFRSGAELREAELRSTVEDLRAASASEKAAMAADFRFQCGKIEADCHARIEEYKAQAAADKAKALQELFAVNEAERTQLAQRIESEHRARLQEYEDKLDKEKVEMVKVHEAALSEMERCHMLRLTELQDEHNVQIDAQRAEERSRVDDLISQLRLETDELIKTRASLDESRAGKLRDDEQHTARIRELENQIAEESGKFALAEAKCRELEAAIVEADVNCRAYEKELEERWSKAIEAAMAERNEVQVSLDQLRLDKLRGDKVHAARIQELEDRLAHEKGELVAASGVKRQQLEVALVEARTERSNLEQRLSAVDARLTIEEAKCIEGAKYIEEANAKINELQANLVAERAKAEEAREKTSFFEEDANTKLQRTVAAERDEHLSAIAAANSRHQLELEQLEARLSAAHRESLSEAEACHAALVAQLKAESYERERAAAVDASKRLEQLLSERDEAAREVEERHVIELDEQRASLDAALSSALSAQAAELQEKFERHVASLLQEARDDYEQAMRVALAERDKAHASALEACATRQARRSEGADSARREVNELRGELEAARKRQAVALRDADSRAKVEVNELRAKLQAEQRAASQQIAKLEAKIEYGKTVVNNLREKHAELEAKLQTASRERQFLQANRGDLESMLRGKTPLAAGPHEVAKMLDAFKRLERDYEAAAGHKQRASVDDLPPRADDDDDDNRYRLLAVRCQRLENQLQEKTLRAATAAREAFEAKRATDELRSRLDKLTDENLHLRSDSARRDLGRRAFDRRNDESPGPQLVVPATPAPLSAVPQTTRQKSPTDPNPQHQVDGPASPEPTNDNRRVTRAAARRAAAAARPRPRDRTNNQVSTDITSRLEQLRCVYAETLRRLTPFPLPQARACGCSVWPENEAPPRSSPGEGEHDDIWLQLSSEIHASFRR